MEHVKGSAGARWRGVRGDAVGLGEPLVRGEFHPLYVALGKGLGEASLGTLPLVWRDFARLHGGFLRCVEL